MTAQSERCRDNGVGLIVNGQPIARIAAGDWVEELHPRDFHGRFGTKDGADVARMALPDKPDQIGRDLPPDQLPYRIGVPRTNPEGLPDGFDVIAEKAIDAHDALGELYREFDPAGVPGGVKMPYDQFEAAVVAQLDAFRDQGDIVVRVPWIDAPKVAEQGVFKSQFETGDSMGTYNPYMRGNEERSAMGVPDDIPVALRPIYGAMERNVGSSEERSTKMYGDVQFVMKDDVKGRATVTFGDSLANGTIPVPVRGTATADQLLAAAGHDALIDASFTTLTGADPTKPERGSTGFYREVQIHGGLTTDAVDRVVVPPKAQWPLGWDVTPLPDVVSTLEANGMSVSEASTTAALATATEVRLASLLSSLTASIDPDFEAKHPRDHGKFAVKEGEEGAVEALARLPIPDVPIRHEQGKPSVWSTRQLVLGDSGDANELNTAKLNWMRQAAASVGFAPGAVDAIDEEMMKATDSEVWSRGTLSAAAVAVQSGDLSTPLAQGVALQQAWTQQAWDRLGLGDALGVSRATRVDAGNAPVDAANVTSWVVDQNVGQVAQWFKDRDLPVTWNHAEVTRDQVLALPWAEGRLRSSFVNMKGEVLAMPGVTPGSLPRDVLVRLRSVVASIDPADIVRDDHGRFASKSEGVVPDPTFGVKPSTDPADSLHNPGYHPGDWDRSGDVPRWVQDHVSLVRDALWSWKGAPADMRIQMDDAAKGMPQPDSGSGKIMRAQAEALAQEVGTNGRPNDRPLYRGDTRPPVGLTPWSESKRVADRFARTGGGTTYTLPKGEGRGIKVADYIASGMDESEREWIMDTTAGQAELALDR